MGRSKAWFAFYPGDFETDTADLTNEEVGAYIRLLSFHFSNDSIPADLHRISNILRVSKQKARKLFCVLKRFFYEKDGRFYQQRMVAEIAKAVEISEKRVEMGRKGGLAKAKAIAVAKVYQSQPQPQLHKKTTPKPPPKRFGDWWSEYPVKVEKKRAEEIWIRKKCDRIADTLIADVKKRKAEDGAWLKDGGKYIPNPTTYLNGERWADAIKPIRADDLQFSIPKNDDAAIRLGRKLGIEAKVGQSMYSFRTRLQVVQSVGGTA